MAEVTRPQFVSLVQTPTDKLNEIRGMGYLEVVAESLLHWG
jgi:hypothetical protein